MTKERQNQIYVSYILGNKLLEGSWESQRSFKVPLLKKYERFIRLNFYLMTFDHF